MMQRRAKRALHTDLQLSLIVLYHHPTRQQQAVVKATELREREEALAEEKEKLPFKWLAKNVAIHTRPAA
jgi:hypothetical protein